MPIKISRFQLNPTMRHTVTLIKIFKRPAITISISTQTELDANNQSTNNHKTTNYRHTIFLAK